MIEPAREGDRVRFRSGNDVIEGTVTKIEGPALVVTDDGDAFPCRYWRFAEAMTDRTIADYLRGATSDGVIEGWYHTGPLAANDWVVNSRHTGARQMTRAETIGYVEMLKEAGLDPRPIKWPE